MRYAALGGGKRMRPLLVYASGALFQAEENAAGRPGHRSGIDPRLLAGA